MPAQVGRRQDSLEDAAVLTAVRAAVGPSVQLRADANRAWKLPEALAFAEAASAAALQVGCSLLATAWPHGSLQDACTHG